MELVVAITGASGAVYGLCCIQTLAKLGIKQNVIISSAGLQVMRHETEINLPDDLAGIQEAITASLDIYSNEIKFFANDDFMAPFCSGSYMNDGMIVIPCSMSTLARINQGIASNLILRTADVMLKERRKLVLVARETPLSLIHLRNMQQLTSAGAVIVPAMPAFYHHPETVQDMVDFVVGKTLDQFDIEHDLYKRFGS